MKVHPDLRARMRDGVAGALHRAAGAQRVSGTSLVALLCAAALTPVVTAGVALGPVVLAAVGVAGSVGANVLADAATDVVDRLRKQGRDVSPASVERALAARLEETLAGGGETAASVREATAALLQGVDAVASLVEAALARDQQLLPAIAEGFSGLSQRFGEFAFVIDDLRQQAWDNGKFLREQQAILRAEQERAQGQDLMLLRVLEAVENSGATSPRGSLCAADPVWPGCPYLGLMPFREEHARVFYGRKELVARLLQRLGERLNSGGILAVVGASGAGKSSLLSAGMLPRLAAGALGPGTGRWPRRVLQPTGSPMRELARHLADLAATDTLTAYQALSRAPDQTPLLIERALAGMARLESASPRLVLVADQFEQLLIGAESSKTAHAELETFVTALHALATLPTGQAEVPAALVVVAIRGDFLDAALSYPALAAAVGTGPFTVRPMSEAEVRLAITGPAAEAGASVEPALVEAVLTELRGAGPDGELNSAVLPLLSQAMADTWEHADDGRLTERACRRAGGVADAVNRSAQAAYEALTRRQQDAARLMFTRLTVITADGKLARRRCSLDDLRSAGSEPTDFDAVVDAFRTRRLLALEDGGAEISHDALLQSWTRLRGWLDDNRLDHAWYSQVITDAQAWKASHRDPSYLYRAGRLAEVTTAVARWADLPAQYPPLPPVSSEFLGAAQHAQRRATGRRRAVIVGLAILTLITSATAILAVRNADSARRQHAIALSRQLAADSVNLASGSPLMARQLAVAAWRVFPTSQARALMASLLAEQQQANTLSADPSGVNGVAFSSDGELLADAGSDGSVRLWNPVTGRPTGIAIHDDPRMFGGIRGVAFNPDGTLLATAGADGTVRLWNPVTGKPASAILHADSADFGSVNGVAFSPDGRLLASADSDGTVQLWDTANGQPAHPAFHVTSRGTNDSGVTGVAFSPDGNLLATTDGEGAVQLWDVATGKAVGRPIQADSSNDGDTAGRVHSVAFSPDGKLLASADEDGTVRLWNTATGQPGPVMRADPGTLGGVTGVAFSPDGQLLASAAQNGTVGLWDVATGQPDGPTLRADPANSGVLGVAFSHDGKILASADGNGTVRLWDMSGHEPASTAFEAGSPSPSGAGAVTAVAFSPNGKLLASAAGDNTVRLWNPVTGLPLTNSAEAIRRAFGGVTSVAFSPDGKLLAIGGDSRPYGAGTVWLWNPVTWKSVGAPLPAGGAGNGVNEVTFSPDGKLLAAASENNDHRYATVHLWNVATGQPFRASLRVPDPNGNGISAVAFSPDGRLLADAGGNGGIQLWHLPSGQADGSPMRPDQGSTGRVHGVAFSPDGQLLASADDNGTVRLWNLVTGQPTGLPLRADAPDTANSIGGVNGVAFSPDGRILASADGDGYVRLWDPQTGRPLGVPIPADIANGVNAVAFTSNGRFLISADVDGRVQTWRVSAFIHPYTALCADVGPLPHADWARYAPGEPEPRMCGS